MKIGANLVPSSLLTTNEQAEVFATGTSYIIKYY